MWKLYAQKLKKTHECDSISQILIIYSNLLGAKLYTASYFHSKLFLPAEQTTNIKAI